MSNEPIIMTKKEFYLNQAPFYDFEYNEDQLLDEALLRGVVHQVGDDQYQINADCILPRIPTQIWVKYDLAIMFNLADLGVDPHDVKDWRIKDHILFITHLDDSKSEHPGPTYNGEHVDETTPETTEVMDDELVLAAFPNESKNSEREEGKS
tara:strand:+ start:147 stop:602 length:456 start_codon:yes stop_codon:yes gene_type:complete